MKKYIKAAYQFPQDIEAVKGKIKEAERTTNELLAREHRSDYVCVSF